MKKTIFLRILISGITIMTLLLTGCGTSPSPKFYTLTPLAQLKPVETGVGIEGNLPVAIGPVEIPEYLDRPEIVTRAEQNQLILSEFNLWGGSLKADVNRVLLENISHFLGSDGISVVTWKIGIAETQRVPIQVVRFDGAPNDKIILKARWSVIGKDGKTFELVRESNISVPVRGGSYSSVVAAMSEVLGEFSKEIASGIKSLVKNK